MSQASPLNGTWYSSVGSRLELRVEGNALKGHFHSTQATGRAPVFGSVVDDPGSQFLPVAFSASWPAGEDYGPSVTSYTGQYSNKNGHEQIEIIFLLADQVASTVLWKSTSIAWDVFTRQPLEAD